ncbi:glycoside hydrolase family 9 protein [Botrimarina sp.]|uniref:glycoside hydrolase family 9 protein n=1 Tax=Botrimarina sp. TaxID=2795802 RepID=UPI0032EB0558
MGCTCGFAAEPVFIRTNQLGYLATDPKSAIVFSQAELPTTFQVVDLESGEVRFGGDSRPASEPNWNAFACHARLDFTELSTPGRYVIRLQPGGAQSRPFRIGPDAFANHVEDLLGFMRQQRCGYNPLLDMVCHQRDGRTAYGPRPTGTFVDASGGWHDAGDQLKYLLTASNATARMLLAYELEPTKFADRVDRMGHAVPNGWPDVLDEARWGLDWIHKLHPKPGQLYHQVADDRDHKGWKSPDADTSDYGWGPNSYRVLYFADGKPQGLKQYKSDSDGVANLAGRCAAAMAMGHRVWKERGDPVFAERCLAAARDLYAMGAAAEGVQQGNSYGAPYRYAEVTWADDMEWGAAELYRETGEPGYLEQAKRYARLAGDTGWMHHEQTGHYEYYPFVNVGHFALWPHVDASFQEELAGYYRSGLDATVARAETNVYGVGVPFIWCSNNLTTALITQALLYERMTGDTRYREHATRHRDWLLGRNPWGTTMFTGVPRDGDSPRDVHTGIWKLFRRDVPGGLVDGPVYRSVFDSLIGIRLNEPDEYSEFQNEHVAYHDDFGDYSTNEPTMDGTAGAIYFMAHYGRDARHAEKPRGDLEISHGAVVRGGTAEPEIALVFTGGEHTDGAEEILATLADRRVKASFFLTGDFLAQPGMADWTRRAVARGHYVGPHSHSHPLYAPWDDRERSLLTKEEFLRDLRKNLDELRTLGGAAGDPVWFIPPYEWHNARHAEWAAAAGCRLFNFTPGSGSHRDFAPEGHNAFRPSAELIQGILAHEEQAPHGLNGHLLLLHLGSTRRDRVPPLLPGLIDALHERGYELVTVDQLLGP